MPTSNQPFSDRLPQSSRPLFITLLSVFHGLIAALLLLVFASLFVQQWTRTGSISLTTPPMLLAGLFIESAVLLVYLGRALWRLERRIYPVIVTFYSLAAFTQLLALLSLQQQWLMVTFVFFGLVTIYLLLPRVRTLFT